MSITNRVDSQAGLPTSKSMGGPSPDVKIEKKRYVWIDNARIVAAILIICVHLSPYFSDNPYVVSLAACNLTSAGTLCGRVPFFLILAGYFLGRRITWHKAIDRGIWLFIPYAIWNIIVFLGNNYHSLGTVNPLHMVPYIFGTTSFFSPDITFCTFPVRVPADQPIWFLRDIIIMSLLTPILVKLRWLILTTILLAISFCGMNLPFQSSVTLAPYACFYYILGTCLCNYRIDDAYHIFNKRFTPIYIASVIAIAITCVVSTTPIAMGHEGSGSKLTLVAPVFGAMLIAYTGELIEKHLPRLSKKLAPCGPACFLVFVLHMPVLQVLSPLLPDWIAMTALVWLVPIFVCALIIFVFLLMKKYGTAPYFMIRRRPECRGANPPRRIAAGLRAETSNVVTPRTFALG